jgi:perosamine synthetase
MDSNYETFGIDPQALINRLKEVGLPHKDGVKNKYTGCSIKAIVPMHTFGHPCMMDEIVDIGNRFGIAIVEDAAESLGSKYKGRHTGTLGKIGAISFNGNKIITTGGGGAMVFNDDNLADEAKHLTTTAKLPHTWDFFHDRLGYNFRMPNLNAALGCAQLRKLERYVKAKRTLFDIYESAIGKVNGLRLFKEPAHCESNYWLQTIILDSSDLALRDRILNHLNMHGIMARPLWRLLHELPMYRDMPRANTPVAEDLQRRSINIPSSVFLSARANQQ